MPTLTRQDLWAAGQDETVEVNQRALIDSQCLAKPVHLSSPRILRALKLARYMSDGQS